MSLETGSWTLHEETDTEPTGMLHRAERREVNTSGTMTEMTELTETEREDRKLAAVILMINIEII